MYLYRVNIHMLGRAGFMLDPRAGIGGSHTHTYTHTATHKYTLYGNLGIKMLTWAH